MSKLRIFILITVGISACIGVSASERKAYKIVDEKGNVTYSQTPPAPGQGKSTQKVDISPASSGRGGYATENRAPNYQQSNDYADRHNAAVRSRQKQQEEAEQRRQANLRSECTRNRGADCDNPETLRLIESQKIPGGRSYR